MSDTTTPRTATVKCKHCGKPIVKDSAGRGWRHGTTGSWLCSETYAEPKASYKSIMSLKEVMEADEQ